MIRWLTACGLAFAFVIACAFGNGLHAQGGQLPDIALLGTASSGGGGSGDWGPHRLNNNDLTGTYNDCWTTGTLWVQIEWTQPVKVFTMTVLYTRYRSLGANYNFHKGDIQYWDGNGWQTDHTYDDGNYSNVADDFITMTQPRITDKVRIQFLPSNHSNVMIQEWMIYPPPATVWSGAISTDWNNPNNWESKELPSFDLGAEIPDASTTPNSPILPAGASCADLILKPGAVLNGGSGSLSVYGNWNNEGGGIFNYQNSTVEYVGAEDQEIAPGGGHLGRVQIKNTVGKVILTHDLTVASGGTITSDPGTVFTVEALTADFSGFSSIQMQGDTQFGVIGLQSITSTASHHFGRVFGTVVDVTDSIAFNGQISMGAGSAFSGMGTVQFAGSCVSPSDSSVVFQQNGIVSNLELSIGDMVFRTPGGGTAGWANAKSLLVDTPVGSDLVFRDSCTYSGNATFNNKGSCTVQGDLTGNSVVFNNEGPVTIEGDIVANAVSFNNTGLVTILGNTRSLTGNIVIGGDALLDTGGIIDAANGTVMYSGNLDLTVGGFAGNAVVLDGLGVVTVNGNIDVTDLTITNQADVSVTGTIRAEFATFNSPATVMTTGNVTIERSLNLQSTGPTSFGNNFILEGDMQDTATGDFTVAQTMTVNGAGSKLELNSENHVLRAQRLSIVGSSLVLMRGSYLFTSTSPFNAALQVAATAGLELVGHADIRLGSGGSGRAVINGVLATDEDGSSGTILRPTIGGASGASQAIVRFSGTSALAVNGLVFDRVGPATQPYGVVIEDGSTINAFNKVSFMEPMSTIATLQLETSLVPAQFNELVFESTDININNIDASAISLVDAIFVTKGEMNGGNIFGTSREVDPNDAIIWEDPSLLDILTEARLPSALVGTPYTVQVQVIGGNRPYDFVITQKPDWLSLDPIAGVLSGQPTLQDIGTYLFPVTVIDATRPTQSISKVFTLQVESLSEVDLTILNFGLSKAKEGEVYSQNIVAAGGVAPYTFVRTGTEPLPTGLSLSPGGAIFGVPLTGTRGVYTIRIRAQDSSSPTQTIETEMKLTVQSDLSDPVFLAIASEDPGSGCTVNSQRQGFWLWMLAGLASLTIVLRRRSAKA